MKVRITVDDSFLRFHGVEKDCYYYATKTERGCIVISDIGEPIELHKDHFIETETNQ